MKKSFIYILFFFLFGIQQITAFDLVQNPTDLQRGQELPLVLNIYTQGNGPVCAYWNGPQGKGQLFYSGTLIYEDYLVCPTVVDPPEYKKFITPLPEPLVLVQVKGFPTDFNHVGFNFILNKNTGTVYRINNPYFFFSSNYLFTMAGDGTQQVWQVKSDGTDVGYYSGENWVSQVPITTRNLVDGFVLPDVSKGQVLIPGGGTGFYSGLTAIGYTGTDGKQYFWDIGNTDITALTSDTGFIFSPIFNTVLSPVSWLSANTTTGVNKYSIINSNGNFAYETDNIGSGTIIKQFTYFENPNLFFKISDNSYQKWDINCIQPGFDTCSFDINDSNFYCTDDQGIKGSDNIQCTGPVINAGDGTSPTSLSGIVTKGAEDHTYDTGIKTGTGDLTCSNILTETGYTYNPQTTFLAGDISNEDIANRISRITDDSLVELFNYGTGTTFDNNSFIYGSTGTTTIIPNDINRKQYLHFSSLTPFNYLKIIPTKITPGLNNNPIEINSEWADDDKAYFEGLYSVNNGYFRFNNDLNLLNRPIGAELVLYKGSKYEIKGFELGIYSFQFESKWNCRDQYGSCEWQYMPDGSYSCSTTSGFCMIVDGNICQRNPEKIRIGNDVDSPGKVVDISQQTDDIFYCPDYETWLDFPACVITIIKNIFGTTKKSIEAQTTANDKNLAGSLRKIGDTSNSGTINYGQWSESGSNIVDNMFRKTWNKSRDTEDPMLGPPQFAFWGAILLVVITIIGTIFYFSMKKG